MAEENAKSTAPEPEEISQTEPETDEDEERRALVLRNGITWESFERFLKVFGKWYPGE